jgi:hypothetical protein
MRFMVLLSESDGLAVVDTDGRGASAEFKLLRGLGPTKFMDFWPRKAREHGAIVTKRP